ncbi:MAG: rod shape-determining protein MreD [Chloroflexota bacterium]
MNVRTLHPGFITAIWLLPVLALLQASVARHLAMSGVYPALVLMLVVNWGILRGVDEGMLWAFLGGLCLDTFSGWPFGTSTVALVLVASLVSLGQSTFMKTHVLLPPITMLAATFLYYAVVLFIWESTQHPVDWIDAIRRVVFPAAIYNAVLNIPGFWLVQRLESRIYPMPRANW